MVFATLFDICMMAQDKMIIANCTFLQNPLSINCKWKRSFFFIPACTSRMEAMSQGERKAHLHSIPTIVKQIVRI